METGSGMSTAELVPAGDWRPPKCPLKEHRQCLAKKKINRGCNHHVKQEISMNYRCVTSTWREMWSEEKKTKNMVKNKYYVIPVI